MGRTIPGLSDRNQCRHINLVDEAPETFDHFVRILCTLVLAAFIFCIGLTVVNTALYRATSLGSNPTPRRQDSAASSPDTHVPTPARKTSGCFLRHTFAGSSTQIPCTITERKALTVVGMVCDCERSFSACVAHIFLL